MYRIFLVLTAILLIGDPTLNFLAPYGVVREALMVFIMTLIVTPWVIAQLEN